MKRPEINWTAVSTVLTGIGVVVALGSLQFSLSESTAARIDAVRSDMHTPRSDVSREIGAPRSEVSGEIGAVRAEIGALRSEVSEEIGAVRAEIGALRSEVREEIRILRSDMNEEFGAVRAEIGALRSDVNEEFGAVRAEVTGEINALRSRLQEESMFNQEMIHDLARGTASLIMNHEHESGLHRGKILPESRADDDAPPPDEE